MTERERLIELYEKASEEYSKTNKAQFRKNFICDYLIKNGVIVPPCKVGDTVYETDGIHIYKSEIKNVIYCTKNVAFDERALGKTVFLTREEAEKALKARDSK